MTLIIAARGKDHIIVGSDSRAIREDRSHNRIQTNIHNKLIKLNDHNCILIAGDSEKGRYLTEEFKPKIKPKDDIKKILKKFCKFSRKEFKNVYDYLHPELWPEVTFILAGFEKDKTGKSINPRLFIVRSDDMFEEGEAIDNIIEGKDIIAKYLFAKRYEESMTQEETTELVFDCLYDTENIDGDAGGKYTMEIITKLGFTSIDTIRMKNEKIADEENRKYMKIMEKN